MKSKIKKLLSLLLAPLLVGVLSTTAFAADSTVTFKGAADGFELQPGSEYTATDLFDGFKGVMPGDELTETVKILNKATDCDYINVYMRAVVHHETDNSLTVNGNEDGEVAGRRGGETVASMQDFLSKLTMRIYNGDELIYNSSPDKAGALADNVFLGSLKTGENLDLKVELDVPAELGNEYADRVGEVDWVFLVECIEYEKLTVHKVWSDNGYPERPSSVTVYLLKDGEKAQEIELNANNRWTYTWDDLDDRNEWTVEEKVPNGYEVSYKTEDNKVFITNYKEWNPTPNPEPINLTVKKVWSDDNNKQNIRPGKVTVTLYNGGAPVDKVTLSAQNNWTYSWTGLDGNGSWSVLETGIPKGYTPSYSTSGETVTITNTATLIHTGQSNLPIAVLGGLGAAMIICGFVLVRRKKEN